MREIRTSGSEGGGNELNHFSLPLSRTASSDLRTFGSSTDIVGSFQRDSEKCELRHYAV